MADSKKTASEPQPGLDRVLSIEIARVTEAAAIASAHWRGRGDKNSADGAAVKAMREELAKVNIRGRVVIGEGEMDEAPMLYIGEELGTGNGPEVDIAVDPLEGTTICAEAEPNALAVIAIAERGGLLNAPDMYMEKIAIGPGYPDHLINIDAPVADNLHKLAKAKGVGIERITVCMLGRPRHDMLLKQVRACGASVRLIRDGDIAGVIWTTDPEKSGIDMYLGSGGAPEGVLAAAALRCIGGQMQGRLLPDKGAEGAAQIARAHAMGITDIKRVYTMQEMASVDSIFSASGVTDGSLLDGVHFRGDFAETETVVMRARTGTVRRIKTTFRILQAKAQA
jgi:fructose-1,6-bisphosphatase II / sedoheptulose-1,7-bisphosphatase